MEFVAFRRDLHRFAETSGKEFETTEKIKAIAIKHGVRAEQITSMPSTGLWIDLRGEAPPHGRDVCIALRADIDALEMTEGNEGLQYRSVKVGAAHMCGHDGHTATLAATIPLFLAKAPTIPNNKRLRLIFQPAEEAVSLLGAYQMIKAGCLEGVDQIYGYHNHNISPSPFGYFSCKEGIVMRSSTHLTITITGDEGGINQMDTKKQALPRAVAFYSALMRVERELKARLGNVFTIMLPVLQTAEDYNDNYNKNRHTTISPTVRIEGTIRYTSTEVAEMVLQKIKSELTAIHEEGYHTTFQTGTFPVTINHKKQSDIVIRLAKELYGEEMAGSFGLPCKAGEDFGRYTEVIPGAFFFVSGCDSEHKGNPHNANYNFNDKLIPLVSNFWMKLLEDRYAEDSE